MPETLEEPQIVSQQNLNGNEVQEQELRSEAVQEILTRIPNWMIRWGITLIFVLLLVMVMLTTIIKYPEIITGKAYLTTVIPTPKLASNISGRMSLIHVADGQQVKQGEMLASIENPLSEEGLLYLEHWVNLADSLLAESNIELPRLDSSVVFGAVQNNIVELQRACLEYKHLTDDPTFEIEQRNLQSRINEHQQLIQIFKKQVSIGERELENATKNYNGDSLLYLEGAISEMTFLDEESNFHLKEQALENFKQSYVMERIAILDLKKQLNNLQVQNKNRRRDLKQRIQLQSNLLSNEIVQWEQQFVIRANTDGTLVWLKHYSPLEFVQSGTPLFALIPAEGEIEAVVEIQSLGFGKVEPNQEVRVKLDNFPHAEYGVLKGRVKEITPISNENLYRVHVSLNQDMRTNYGNDIKYLPEMSGSAEIVTKNLTLFERIIYQLRKALDRS